MGDGEGRGIELMRVVVDRSPRIVHRLQLIAQVDETRLVLVYFFGVRKCWMKNRGSCEQQ